MNSLMHQVEAVAKEAGATRVMSISVWLGALSHMSEQHFTDHFNQASAGTIAEGARLHITLSQDIHDTNAQLIRLESVEVDG
ncbi:MAG: hydrogenase/urease maturation nickel metallochaperone HypA [Burkholderiales bacterium]